MTQDAVADRVSLSRTSITNIEKGRQHISLHMLFHLSAAVGVDPHELIPKKDIISESEAIDHKVLNKAQLKDDHLNWVKRVVTSGITKEENNDEPR